jgi:uncharacterized protein (DUF58 family)
MSDSRLARWRSAVAFAPTPRLALLAALTAPAWLGSGTVAGVWTAAGVTLAVVMAAALDAIFTAGRGHLTVERALPSTTGIGDPVPGGYHLTSRWPAAVRVTLYDAMPATIRRGEPAGDDAAAGEGHPRTAATRERVRPVGPPVRLAAGGSAGIPFTLTAHARGRFALGRVALRIAGPLGLVARTARLELDDEITVAPSIAGVRRYRLLAIQRRLRDAGIRAIRRRGEGTNFSNLREYVRGDDPRHIDWKATARRRKVITREFTVEQGQTVMIVVDAGRLMTQLAGEYSRYELALSSAMVLADVAVHSGDQVGLMVFDDQVRAFVPPARGAAALQRIRQALIPTVATMSEPDYAAAFRTLSTRHRRRSLIVVYSDVIDTRASQALIAHMLRGATRHLPLVVALRNDALVAAAAPGATATSSMLFERAAAEELLSAREEALARMRQAGVSVVDVSPRLMTAAVVNRYLEIKARASL